MATDSKTKQPKFNTTTLTSFTGEVPNTEDLVDITSLGDGLSIVSNRKLPFSNDLAIKVLETERVPWERGLRNNHITYLIAEMKKGLFLTEITSLATCYCEEVDKEFRINGQHSCWARTELTDKEYPPSPITVLKYGAKTLEDVRRLYARFDRGAVRTRNNITQTYLAGTKQFEGVSASGIRALSAGFYFWIGDNRNERNKFTTDDVSFLMQKDHEKVVSQVILFAQQKPDLFTTHYLRRASVLAAMFETFSKNVLASQEFWHAIKVGLGFTSTNDPRLKLRNALMTTVINKTHNVNKKEKKVTDSESIYRWCITAFNAWRAGEEISVFRVPNKRQRAK